MKKYDAYFGKLLLEMYMALRKPFFAFKLPIAVSIAGICCIFAILIPIGLIFVVLAFLLNFFERRDEK